MGKEEKNYLLISIIVTVVTIIAMTIVALVIPKEKFMGILLIEITLALLWTVIFAWNTVVFLKKNKLKQAKDENDEEKQETK